MNWLRRLFTPDRGYPWRPGWATIRREADVHPHVADERAELFEAHNTGSTEFEVLHWLHSTIRLLKPERVLETGACDGLGTIALASACRLNGRGVVHSVEIDPLRCEQLAKKVVAEGLERFVQVHCRDSLEFLKETELVFDIGFYDSLCELRAAEFRTCLERGLIRRVAVFHDTSPKRCDSLSGWPDRPLHDRYRMELRELAADPRCSGWFESPLSRGLVAIFLNEVSGG